MSESVAPTTRGSVPSTHLGSAAHATVAVLTFIDGLLAGHEVELQATTTIGRRKDASILVPAEERAVSAMHCTIRRTASGMWIVEDTESAGGTWLNRERLGPGVRPVLRSGDVVGLGQHGPTAIFTLRSAMYASAGAPRLYAITLARTAVEHTDRRRFADRPLLVLGRDRECDLRFDPHGEREVSKRHARIRYGGRCFILEDTASAGGTLLNGVRLGAPALLRAGDIIELGVGGPKLVVEALEGVDDAAEQAEAALALAHRVARRSGRRALLGSIAAIAIAGTISGAMWWSADPPPVSTTEQFQSLARTHAPATLLIYARFRIEVDGVHDAAHPFFVGDTFGSGFVISADGLAVTNRHVAEPWLGEPEYADALARAREAFGAEHVKLVSEIAAWPAGAEAFDGDRLAFDRGFHSGKRANLEVVGFPPEHLADVPFGEGTVKLVANDHTDLALLRLEGGAFDATSVPRLAAPDHALQPLDPVMSLGFPAGRTLLEGTTASASATLGEVRKIESTVQLSMPTYPGNSGAPVFDLDGEVIGVTTRRYGESVAVCIPIAEVRGLLRRLDVSI